MPLKDFLDKISKEPKQSLDAYKINLKKKIKLENLQNQGFINKHKRFAEFLYLKLHSSIPLSISAGYFNSITEDNITNLHKAFDRDFEVPGNMSITVLEAHPNYTDNNSTGIFMPLLEDVAGELTLDELLLRLKASEDQLNSDSKKTKTTSTSWSTRDKLLGGAFMLALISLVVWGLSKHTKTSKSKNEKSSSSKSNTSSKPKNRKKSSSKPKKNTTQY